MSVHNANACITAQKNVRNAIGLFINTNVKFISPCALDKLYHTTINHLSQVDQQKHSKLLEQAYIVLKEQLKGLKGWYRLQEGEQKNIRFFIKYAKMRKLCQNLQKLQKSYDYTELALNLILNCQLKHKYKEVTQLQLRYQQLRIQISRAKSKKFNNS